MDSNLFRYIWQKSRGEQILVLLIILVSIPFNWASFDVPKRIVNDAIQGGAFKDGKTTALSSGLIAALLGGNEDFERGLLVGMKQTLSHIKTESEAK